MYVSVFPTPMYAMFFPSTQVYRQIALLEDVSGDSHRLNLLNILLFGVPTVQVSPLEFAAPTPTLPKKSFDAILASPFNVNGSMAQSSRSVETAKLYDHDKKSFGSIDSGLTRQTASRSSLRSSSPSPSPPSWNPFSAHEAFGYDIKEIYGSRKVSFNPDGISNSLEEQEIPFHSPPRRPISALLGQLDDVRDDWLLHRVETLVNMLNGNFELNDHVLDQLIPLFAAYGLADTVTLVVERLVHHAITKGFPASQYLGNFLMYMLDTFPYADPVLVADGEVNPPSCEDIRSALLKVFNDLWMHNPLSSQFTSADLFDFSRNQALKTNHYSLRHLIRLSALYGRLYNLRVLQETDFRFCINALSSLSPLPKEGLYALFQGDISRFQEQPF
ncbi:hypothetical protein M422DRAFT_779097 [Sphaerobolus stellatus SS14]|uniref:Unplaced genomic scaffold SPHSTscaffold_38, whole genome shotgun sequence n=1 Tax=Sphaerobolus stellatus (strain SS14) TaxID=990650 RepID=A0A0C9W2E1_SPHS4|nr:hypothetical protein M422DRAFT_779097 [Sphaerobolus stellatus SS14]